MKEGEKEKKNSKFYYKILSNTHVCNLFTAISLSLSFSLSLNQIHPHNFHSEPDRKNCGLATLSPREPDARSLSLGAQKCDGDLVLSRFEWKMTIVDDGYFK